MAQADCNFCLTRGNSLAILVMAIYNAMAVHFADCELAEGFKHLLDECGCDRSAYHVDGLHLNTEGLKLAAVFIEHIVREHALDAVVGDSCLCATDKDADGWSGVHMDYDGEILSPLVSVPCYPAAGKGFTSSGGGFSEIVKQAFYGAHPRPKVIGLFCAGNDLWQGNCAVAVAKEMYKLQEYWAEWGVSVVYIDVVPDRFRTL
jgi:hypothetical protein